MTVKVTMAHLKAIGACQPAREWFRATYGEDTAIPLSQVLRALVDSEDGLYWVDWVDWVGWVGWYFDSVRLPALVEAAYRDAISAANAAYQSAIEAAEHAYWKATVDYVVYQEAISAALAAYQEAHRLAVLAAADACETTPHEEEE